MNEDIKLNKYVSPLKRICMTIGELPSSYLESMSYYESITWLFNYLNTVIIKTINDNALITNEQIKDLNDKIDEAYNYLKENLNQTVSDIIHEELETGTLQFELINVYNEDTERLDITGSVEGGNE